MLFITRIIVIFFTLGAFFTPLTQAEDLLLRYHQFTPPADPWPDGYYILYGVIVAAIVLFVMAVMKKPDDVF